jgi:multidrug efflux pump subunit AcrA (membrane-fusion protein)
MSSLPRCAAGILPAPAPPHVAATPRRRRWPRRLAASCRQDAGSTLAVPLLVLALVAVAWAAPAAEEPSAKSDLRARTVILDETGVRNLRLQTVEAEEQDFEETVFALGRVEVLPGRRAVVSSRIAGRALEVRALPDHEVRAGEVVVVVESRLPGDPPPEIELTAPLTGYVTELAVDRGAPVEPGRALLQIVDLRRVYALAAVPQHLAGRLARGQDAVLRVPGWPDESWPVTVEHLGALADAGAGTVEAAFIVANDDLRLRPGMRAEFSIVVDRRPGVLAVPRAALQGGPADRFVYVESASLPFAYERVPVVAGAVNDRFVEITRGLFPGDRVVTTGAYSLAFAGRGSVSLKEALDAAHGHEHNEDGSEITADQRAARAGGSGPGDEGHAHAAPGLSALTWLSLAGNAVLLALLFAGSPAFRRNEPPAGS